MKLDQLLNKTTHRAHADEVQALVERDPARLLPELMDRFTGNNGQIIGVTAMALGNLARAHPHLFQPYQMRLYRASVAHFHPGVRRNVLRYFSEIPVVLDTDHRVPDWVKRKDFLYLRSSQVIKAQHSSFLDPELEGYLLDHAIEIIADVQEIAAPKAYSMLIAQHLCLKYPEIAGELIAVVRECITYGTAGVRSRGKKSLALLERLEQEH